MSNIDFTRQLSAADRVARARSARDEALRGECGALISAALPVTTQLNLAAAAALGSLGCAETRSYGAAQAWVGAMRTACANAIKTQGEARWPEAPKGLARLVERY